MVKKLLTLACCLGLFTASAQTDDKANPATIEVSPAKTPVNRFYMGNSLDGMIFGTSFLTKTGYSRETTPLRFTMFLHLGFTYNYDFNNYSGIYTGLDLKNIGFTEKESGFTIKRRVYTLGIPLGLRFGNMSRRKYVFLGGGVDFAINYKEKQWGNGTKKEKFNEWFSDRSKLVMPYVFLGYCHRGLTLKAQYYPGNFLNEDFTENVSGAPFKPYAGYEKTNLLLFSVGFDMHFKARQR
jgi:hypothetical protein